jgi:hypothetical protein
VTPQHHVLLIGIDAYDGGGMLTGCVNDIDAIQRVLLQRVRITPDRIARLVAPRSDQLHDTSLPARVPTLANIRGELERLGGDEVADGDRVFIYYSGHGTQCIVEDGNQRYAREALLPKDKLVGPTRQFLFDWELNAALAKIAARTPRVTVVLDCCSSGGATRAIATPGACDRFFATPEPVRDVEPVGVAGVVAAIGDVDRCQVVAACRADQRARESVGSDGRCGGELTRALVAQLEASADLEALSWGQIWHGLDAAVRAANPRQSPWLCGRFGRRVFGYGRDADEESGALVQVPAAYDASARLRVRISDESIIAAIGRSGLLEVVDEREDVALVARPDRSWIITDDVFGSAAGEPVLGGIPADRIVAMLEHYRDYIAPVRLARACQDLPGVLRLAMLDCGHETLSGPATQAPVLSTVRDVPRDHRVCFVVANRGDLALEVTLFDASATGSVLVLGEARVPAGAQHVFWSHATLGAPFTLAMPDGATVAVDRIVAIGTTSTTASLEALARSTTFQDALVPTRLLRTTAAAPVLDRWASAQCLCRIEDRREG